MVDRLHREIEGHEFYDRPQAGEGRADAQSREPIFGDRRVDHAARAKLLQQPLRDLIGALIFGDLLAKNEHIGIAAHFLGHGVAQRFAHGHGHHGGSGGNFGLRLHLLSHRNGNGRLGGGSRSRRRRGDGRRGGDG